MPKALASTAEHILGITGDIFLTSQLDDLHLSLDQLNEIQREKEIDLILEQPTKTPAQKTKFLEHVVGEVVSLPLRKALQKKIDEKDFEFFIGHSFGEFISELQGKANTFGVVKLSVAIEFTHSDIQAMAATLVESLGKPIALEVSIERKLIGGATIQYGSRAWDSSVRARLETFRSTWKKVVVETS